MDVPHFFRWYPPDPRLRRYGYRLDVPHFFRWYPPRRQTIRGSTSWMYLTFLDDIHPICYNYLLYNNLRYLPSGISPQHKGFQQPHLNIFIQLFSFISKLLFTNVLPRMRCKYTKKNENKASVNWNNLKIIISTSKQLR